jgi:hypothetical protein
MKISSRRPSNQDQIGKIPINSSHLPNCLDYAKYGIIFSVTGTKTSFGRFAKVINTGLFRKILELDKNLHRMQSPILKQSFLVVRTIFGA